MIKLIKSTFFNEKRTKSALISFIKKAEQLSIGEKCERFEKNLAVWQNRKYATTFNSGSSANLALIQALLNMGKLKIGDRVGISGITWATNVMPLIQLGLKPIPIDISLKTLNVSPRQLKKTHQKHNLHALFLTNLLGFADKIEKIQSYCRQNNIILLEDNCESMGSEINQTKLGNFSLASTFSFFVGHHMSAIEGGAVLTDDEELDSILKMVRSHGWDRHVSESKRKSLRESYKVDDFFAKYTFYDLAYNLRPTEITGFLGNYQLKYINDTVKIRENNFIKFLEILNNPKYYQYDFSHMNLISNFAMPLVCKNIKNREKMLQISTEADIEVRPIVGGVMADQPFFKKYIKNNFDLPNSRLVNNQGLYFGNNPELSKDEISHIVNSFLQL